MLSIPAGSLRSRRYRAVFFDAGNTLLKPHPSVGERYAAAARAFGLAVAAEDMERAFRAEWARRSRRLGAGQAGTGQAEREGWHDLVRDVLARFGAMERFEEYFEYLYDVFATPEAWRLYPEVEAVLAECRRRDVILGIVSNWDSRLEILCREMRLTPSFKFILYSAGVGVSKPDPRIFALAVAEAGVNPGEVLHVGDSLEEDVCGARAAGLDALWLRREGPEPKAQVATGDSLLDVLELC